MNHLIRRQLILFPIEALAVTGCTDLYRTRNDHSDKDRPVSIVTVVEDFNFEEPGETWTFRTPELWSIASESRSDNQTERRFLRMAAPPERPMMPGVRRPQEYAIYGRYEFRSFNLSVRLRVDNDPAVEGRDACVIFARRDDTHFYYVHLSNLAQGFHNTLVRVDGQTRTSLLPADRYPPPTVPARDWHKLDIIRNADDGTIRVYVDAHDPQANPWIEVTDRTYDWGHIALGSFNDHASFAHLLIEGQARTPR